MQAPEVSELSKGFAHKFCDSLTEALSGASTSGWQVTLATEPSGSLPVASESRSLRYSFAGTFVGDANLILPKSLLSRLALGDIEEDVADAAKAHTAKLLTVLQAGIPTFAASVDEAGATSLRIEVIDEFSFADEQVIELWMQSDPDDPEARTSLHLCLTQKLVAALQSASAKPFEFPNAASSDAANLDLVMEVELNVTLRFGQRQLALREVLELTSGSVVELDRQVDEPVELVLDGRVVARGEAVIIDGNYGMRITQLVQQPVL